MKIIETGGFCVEGRIISSWNKLRIVNLDADLFIITTGFVAELFRLVLIAVVLNRNQVNAFQLATAVMKVQGHSHGGSTVQHQ